MSTTSSPGPERDGPSGTPGPPHDFDAMYVEGTPPWDIGRPQPAFERVASAGELAGRVLDAGCGTGEHALLAAAHGCDALGVDLSTRAVELATAKAAARGLAARFVVADTLRLEDLGERFDIVFDCGFFHVLDDGEREAYVTSLAHVLPSGARCHLLCFSDRQPGDWGPRRVTRDELEASFAAGWAIESIEAAVIELTWIAEGAQAWHLVASRL